MESYTLTEPTLVEVTTVMSPVDCFGNPSGSITATVTDLNEAAPVFGDGASIAVVAAIVTISVAAVTPVDVEYAITSIASCAVRTTLTGNRS